jgi:hypothetical protein
MPFFVDLPTEILDIIIQLLPLKDALNTCLVCRHLKFISSSHIYKSFEANLKSLESFHNTIKKRNSLGQYVKSINVIDLTLLGSHILSVLISLLSRTPNLQQLAICGIPYLVDRLKQLLERQKFSLPFLKTFRVFSSGHNIWAIIDIFGIKDRFPQLSQLSLHRHYCEGFKVELSASSFPLKHVTLAECDLNTESVCDLIKRCECLRSFRYFTCGLLQLKEDFLPLDIQEIGAALELHEASLEEIVFEIYTPHYLERRRGNPGYERRPKFESFAGFSALKRQGMDLDATSAQISLPPSLHSISITNCKNAKECPIVLLRIMEKFSVKSIQVDDARTALSCHSWQKPEQQIVLSPWNKRLSDELEVSNISDHCLPWTQA